MTSVEVDEKAWQAAQIKDALAKVERLQRQLDGLRSAIPDLIEPFSASQSATKALIARGVRDSATDTMAQMKTFRESWASDETQALLERTSKSVSDNPDLSKASNIPLWGWSDSR